MHRLGRHVTIFENVDNEEHKIFISSYFSTVDYALRIPLIHKNKY